MTHRKSTLMGIMFITLSGFFFSLMSVGIRFAGDLPSMQKCVFRNAFALIIAAAALCRSRTPPRCVKGDFWLVTGRAVIGTAGLICNFYANDHMNIADANVLNKLSPFMVLIFSALLLKESFRLAHLLIVTGAFCGCLFVVKPTMDLGQMLPALAGAFGGISAGFALTLVREMGRRGENEMVIVFYFSLCSTLVSLPFMIFDFRPFSPAQFGGLMLAGIGGCGGQLCITKAYRYAPAREISVFDYSQVLFSALFGCFLLDQRPDGYSLIGYGIMLAMGVALFLYNKRHYSGEEAASTDTQGGENG